MKIQSLGHGFQYMQDGPNFVFASYDKNLIKTIFIKFLSYDENTKFGPRLSKHGGWVHKKVNGNYTHSRVHILSKIRTKAQRPNFLT
jgi:hypothetical protein